MGLLYLILLGNGCCSRSGSCCEAAAYSLPTDCGCNQSRSGCGGQNRSGCGCNQSRSGCGCSGNRSGCGCDCSCGFGRCSGCGCSFCNNAEYYNRQYALNNCRREACCNSCNG